MSPPEPVRRRWRVASSERYRGVRGLGSLAAVLTTWALAGQAHAKGLEADALGWLLWWAVASTGVCYAGLALVAARGSRWRWPLAALEAALVVASATLYGASPNWVPLLGVLAAMTLGMAGALTQRSRRDALVFFALVGWWLVPPLATLAVVVALWAWPVAAVLAGALGLWWWRRRRARMTLE